MLCIRDRSGAATRAGFRFQEAFGRRSRAEVSATRLADPNALVVVQAAAAAFERVGLPEGQFHLAEAALYLATAGVGRITLVDFQ